MQVYQSLANKLQHAPPNILLELHSNPSFTEVNSWLARDFGNSKLSNLHVGGVVNVHEALLTNASSESRPCQKCNNIKNFLNDIFHLLLICLFQIKKDESKANKLVERLRESKAFAKKTNASKVVFEAVMKWYKDIKLRNDIQRKLESIQMSRDQADKHNDEDDNLYKYRWWNISHNDKLNCAKMLKKAIRFNSKYIKDC